MCWYRATQRDLENTSSVRWYQRPAGSSQESLLHCPQSLATCLCFYILSPPTFTHTHPSPHRFNSQPSPRPMPMYTRAGKLPLPWLIHHHQTHISHTQEAFVKYAVSSPQLDRLGDCFRQRSCSSQTRNIHITDHLDTKHISNEEVVLDEHNDFAHAY
jgi:hypothetical protein